MGVDARKWWDRYECHKVSGHTRHRLRPYCLSAAVLGVAVLLVAPAMARAQEDPKPPPPEGSQLPQDENICAMCHNEADMWEGETAHLHIPRDKLDEDVHWLKGVNCHDCHGGDPETSEINSAHAIENGFLVIGDSDPELQAKAREALKQRCDSCHEQQKLALFAGVHSKAGPHDPQGRGTLLECAECHGEVSHHLLPSTDSRSPMFLDNQVTTCGGCHEKDLDTYRASVHGHGLYASGLLVTASCADCHGSHGIFRPLHQKSTLNHANVAETCGSCHRFISERLAASVHGRVNGVGHDADRVAPGGRSKETPTCTSCHQGHGLDPKLVEFRHTLPFQCGNCHSEMSHQYALSMHGQLSELGYGPAANCADCHGAHDILPASDPQSRVSVDNRQQTCRSCHPNASANLMTFDPHSDHTDPARSPIEYYVYMTLLTLLFTTFGVFGVHSILWFTRGLVDVVRYGRPKQLVPGQLAYRRFKGFHRTAHTMMAISFIGLAATGLPLKYSHYDWSKSLVYYLGGFDSTSALHRFFGLVTIVCFVVYMLRMTSRFFEGRRAGKPWKDNVFGPDSPVPNWRDFKDFAKMVRWFFGLGPKPTFERWAYWEKFDFWGACADIVIIGLTGLVLWFPSLFCMFLPGVAVNVAKVIHSTQALLATGFVFAIHFFSTHIRAEKFPLDMSILTGLVSEEELEHERPEFLERLRREGELEEHEVVVPPRRHLLGVAFGGLLVAAAGICLLIAILVTYLAK